MRKLLFSRTHKKHYSDTVVRIGKNNLGFSLVELIIVIAIMAILVAVAIPVLGVFIEKAKIANDKQAVADIMYAINLGGQSMQYPVEVQQISDQGLKIPAGMIVLTENGTKVLSANDHNRAALTAILTENVNSDLDAIKLHYDEWSGTTYASFYSSADELMEKVDEVGTNTLNYIKKFDDQSVLFGAVKTDYADGTITVKIAFMSDVNIPITSRDYEDADELTYYLAQAINNLDRDAFINSWANLVSEDSEGFGLSAREYYSAVRAAYSQCFANYVQSNSDETHISCSDHVVDITNYGESAGELLGSKVGSNKMGQAVAAITGGSDVNFPWAVCGATFANHSTADSDYSFVDCEYCEALWGEYYQSEQAKADAAAFYDTMVTGAAYNGSETDDPSDGFVDWAQDMTDSFTDLYGELDTQIRNNESCIVITVYQNTEGLLYGECNTPGISEE